MIVCSSVVCSSVGGGGLTHTSALSLEPTAKSKMANRYTSLCHTYTLYTLHTTTHTTLHTLHTLHYIHYTTHILHALHYTTLHYTTLHTLVKAISLTSGMVMAAETTGTRRGPPYFSNGWNVWHRYFARCLTPSSSMKGKYVPNNIYIYIYKFIFKCVSQTRC